MSNTIDWNARLQQVRDMLPENNPKIQSAIQRREAADTVRRLSLAHSRYMTASNTMHRMAIECRGIIEGVNKDKLALTLRMAGVSMDQARLYSGTAEGE